MKHSDRVVYGWKWCSETGKVQYHSQHSAEVALARIKTSRIWDGQERTPYVCFLCKQWHLGTSREGRIAAVRWRLGLRGK